MTALFVLGAVGLGVTVWLLPRESAPPRSHWAAAITMFAAILRVVVRNALGFHRKQLAKGEATPPSYTNRYARIAGVMLAGGGGMAVWNWTVGWDHAVLHVEGTLIALFGAFWAIQTEELWDGGVRST